jgi:hypothetical protein
MKTRFSVLLLAGLALVGLTVASKPAGAQVEAWVQRYNGPGSGQDVGTAIGLDSSQNVYVTGWSAGTASWDYATLSYDPAGNLRWIRRYSDPGQNLNDAYALAVDSQGHACVTGFSNGVGGQQMVTIKYDSNGNLLWVARTPGIGRDIAIAPSGNVYVTGDMPGTGYSDFITIKYDQAGNELWRRTYNGPGNGRDEMTRIAIDTGENVYVTGGSAGAGTGNDWATIMYRADGTQMWVRRFNGSANGNDWPNAIWVDAGGGSGKTPPPTIYVTGGGNVGSGNEDYITIKYDMAGNVQWVSSFNGPANGGDHALDIAGDGLGGIYVTGTTIVSGTDRDWGTIKYDASGNQTWVRYYDGPSGFSDDVSNVVYAGGRVYAAGGSDGIGNDYTVIVYDTAGLELWSARYNGPGDQNDYVYGGGLAVDPYENVYVTGYSWGGETTGYDYCTIKYFKTPSSTDDDAGEHHVVLAARSFPNPARNSSNIGFTLPRAGRVGIDLLDINGRLVRRLFRGGLLDGEHSSHWNGLDDCGRQVSPGVYFYRVTAGSRSVAGKVVLSP